MYIYLNLSNMGIQSVKVLRTISKIVLLIVAIGVVGYGGVMIYKSVINKPQKVRITNVTDSAATITWITDNPVRGVVYYKEKGTFLPGPLGLIGSKVAYDDRDFANAQDECVKAFNENANITKDANFTVDGSGFDCENIAVEKLGAYYTHSVTIKNLNESSTYFFVVGNGIWSWDVDNVDKTLSTNDLAVTNSFNFKTAKLLETVPTPNIAYGTVYAAEYIDGEAIIESESKDSLVFAYLTINGVNSQTISAVTNTDGGWTFDKSNFRDTEGNLIGDLSKASMVVCSQYEDIDPKVCMEVKEDLDVDTDVDLLGNIVDDLNKGEKNRILEKWEELISRVYAFDTELGDFTSCGSVGVDGCNGAASQCVKKCYIPGTELYKWVSIGTVGEGACSLPYSCGCSPVNKCEDKCENNVAKKRTCSDSGGYNAWTTWSAGSCSGNPCVSEPVCTNGACENVASGARRVCKSGAWVTEAGSCSTSNCTEGSCENVANGARRVCKSGAWVTEAGSCSTSTQCNTAGECRNVTLGHQICQTSYKWGSTISGACPTSGGNNDIVCTDDDGKTILLGQSCPKLGGTCQLNGSCSGVGASCTLTPKYTETEGVRSCLPTSNACTLKCAGETTKVLNSTDCTKLGANRCVTNNTAQPSELKFEAIDLNKADLKLLITVEPAVRKFVLSEINQIEAKYNSGVNCPNYIGGAEEKEYRKWCEAVNGTVTLGGDLVPCDGNVSKFKFNCDIPQSSLIIESSLISKAYAEESTSSGYTLYLPEYGMYSFELGDYQLTTSTTNGNTYHIFYIEANDKAGFQMPADPDNPTPKEDIVLKSSSMQIQHKKVASAQAYTLVKGINIISFNFVPVSTDLGPLTAKGVIDEAAKKGVTIQYISSFEGGRWAKGYTCKNGKCSGNDFTIIPGKGYLVYATKGGEMAIPGYSLKSSVPVNLSGGWNLVGIHGYANTYTAASLIESINKIDGVTANNVTWWPTSKGMYEGLQVTGGQQYGFDFPISPTNGYFVRVSSFKPTDKKCKSLLWNEGGTLNGSCGIVK